MPLSQNFNVANMSLNAIRENKILAKVSEFTVAGFTLSSISQLNPLQYIYGTGTV